MKDCWEGKNPGFPINETVILDTRRAGGRNVYTWDGELVIQRLAPSEDQRLRITSGWGATRIGHAANEETARRVVAEYVR